jgi:hypothetical protein
VQLDRNVSSVTTLRRSNVRSVSQHVRKDAEWPSFQTSDDHYTSNEDLESAIMLASRSKPVVKYSLFIEKTLNRKEEKY